MFVTQRLFVVPENDRTMKVSVVVNTYSLDRYDDFHDAVEAVFAQTYEDVEVVLVIDGNEPLYERVEEEFGGRDGVIVHCTEENLGNSGARTMGGELATGDVIAVTDDDAVPDPEWVEELVRVYEETDAIAVGGKVVPLWVDGEPDFFPEEFYWLIGCNHRGFGNHMEEVRNTFGPNLSFRAEVFDELGGFSEHVGRVGDKQLQAHETEICSRMQREYGQGVIYTENAIVRHKILGYRLEWGWLVRRCFWQGYSKRVLEKLVPDSTGEETDYLKQLLLQFVPNRVKDILTNPSAPKVKQLGAISLFTFLVGMGYIYAILRTDIGNEELPATGRHDGS